MPDTNVTNEYSIDAKGRSLGRVASEAAMLLMGKNRTDFTRNTVAPVKVTIQNAGKMEISARKKEGEIFVWSIGYPGGKKEETLGNRIDRRGIEHVIRKTIHGMLPGNRLRARMMKNLIIEL